MALFILELMLLLIICGSTRASRYPSVDVPTTVDLLNNERRAAGACDMCKLRWKDETLGRLARQETNCGFISSSTTRSEYLGGGQIVSYIFEVSGVTTEQDAMEWAVADWASPPPTRQVYRQLFLANACYVGCEVMACGGRNRDIFMVLCIFNEDLGSTNPPYTMSTTDEPCGCCPTSRPRCNETLGLCYGNGQEMSGGGDPHFSVRVHSGQLFCFNLHGEEGYSFNLISTDDLEMNALFIKLPNTRHGGFHIRMGAIGIVVAGMEFIFNGTSETVSIASNLTLGPDRVRKVTVDENQQIHLSLTKKWPNNKITVHIEQFSITLTIVFVRHHLDMFWSSHGIHTRHVHGILGQFLHSEVKIDEEQGLLLLPWRPAVPIKQKTLFKFARSEDPEEYSEDATCWTPVHRSSQGVGFIEGVYTDYEVESVLSTGFQFQAADHQGNI